METTFESWFPVGTSIRQWGPDRRVAIVVDRRLEVSANCDDTHDLWVYTYHCTNAGDDCAAATQSDVLSPDGVTLRFDKEFFPSTAIEKPGGTLTLHVLVPAKITQDCDADNIEYSELFPSECDNPDATSFDLEELVITADGSGNLTLADEFDVQANANNLCRDRETSFVKASGGFPEACWTVISDTQTRTGWVQCGNRSILGWNLREAVDGLTSSDSLVEHPWFDGRGQFNDRFVAVHNADQTATEVYLLDEPGDPGVQFAAVVDETNYPTIDITSAGKVRLAWQDTDNTTGETTFQYSACAAADDCLQVTDWTADHQSFPSATQHEVDIADQAGHAQLAVDGDKQFILGMVDPPGGNENWGVFLAERCGQGDWTTELVKTRLDTGNDQSIADGVPNIVLNQTDNIIHVAFVEFDDIDSPTEGTVFWARRGYDACP